MFFLSNRFQQIVEVIRNILGWNVFTSINYICNTITDFIGFSFHYYRIMPIIFNWNNCVIVGRISANYKRNEEMFNNFIFFLNFFF